MVVVSHAVYAFGIYILNCLCIVLKFKHLKTSKKFLCQYLRIRIAITSEW